MERIFRCRTLALLCGTALTLVSAANAQDRMQPSVQDRPAASQPKEPNDQPSARPDRGDRPVPQKGERKQDASDPAVRVQKPDQKDLKGPASPTSPQQSRDNERARDNQVQPRENKPNRQGEAGENSDQPNQRNRAEDANKTRNPDNAQPRRDRANDRNARDNAGKPSENNRQVAQPNDQQRTRISASIREAKIQPIRNVNFSLTVGAVVPRTVRVYPATRAIIEVYPQYRGYSFVLVDEDVVIIEPRTKRIVTIIDQRGSGRAASVSRSKLTLSDRQREAIRRSATVRTTGSARVGVDRELSIGDDLPDAIEFETFPDTIYTEVPEIRSYRYIVRDRDIYLVDPTERRVIEIIR